MNGNGLLMCTGGHVGGTDLAAHDNGLFVIDITAAAGVLRHIEDTKNYGAFAQPVQENGAIVLANTDSLSRWGR